METDVTECSVDGCSRPTRSKTMPWCNAHYLRWYRTGNTGDTPVGPYRRDEVCRVADCEKKQRRRGYCDMHWSRISRHGDPDHVDIPRAPGERHWNWTGEDVTYHGMHKRLADIRGAAVDHCCKFCGAGARQWAYDHADSDERISPEGWAYSLDPGHYIPLCVRCHLRFDRKVVRMDRRHPAPDRLT